MQLRALPGPTTRCSYNTCGVHCFAGCWCVQARLRGRYSARMSSRRRRRRRRVYAAYTRLWDCAFLFSNLASLSIVLRTVFKSSIFEISNSTARWPFERLFTSSDVHLYMSACTCVTLRFCLSDADLRTFNGNYSSKVWICRNAHFVIYFDVDWTKMPW